MWKFFDALLVKLVAGLAVVFVAVKPAAASETGIEGKWKRDDGNAIVRIAACGAKVCATNLWIRDTSGGEEVGDRLVLSLQSNSGGTFSGTAYDPKRKLSYSIVVTKRKSGLVTRGCFLTGLLCKDVSWTAAK
jgi:uncharacterized protein (DUF2147 family)